MRWRIVRLATHLSTTVILCLSNTQCIIHFIPSFFARILYPCHLNTCLSPPRDTLYHTHASCLRSTIRTYTQHRCYRPRHETGWSGCSSCRASGLMSQVTPLDARAGSATTPSDTAGSQLVWLSQPRAHLSNAFGIKTRSQHSMYCN